MTVIAAGALLLVAYIGNRYVMGRPPVTTRGAEMLPLMKRMNIFIGVAGVAAILVGLMFPRI